jgi:ABC-2 type transport system ATP-binding protein
VLAVRGLSKDYRRGLWKKPFRALDSIDLEVGRGQIFGLLGPNGAGKTTLVKVLLGLARPSGGEAWLLGERAGKPAPRARVGYLPEAHRLPEYLTGRQVLMLFGMLSGRPRAWLEPRVPEWLERVGMSDSAERKIREYSKGMQQRIGLAQALVHEPELVFLDEPTDGVDPVGRAAIRKIVQGLKERGTTVFINSHLLAEVEQICDRVVIMDRGHIVREGSVAELTPRTGLVRFDVAPLPDDLEALLADVGTGLKRVAGGFELALGDGAIDRAIDRLRARGVSIRAVEPERLTLEDSFIDLVRPRERAP